MLTYLIKLKLLLLIIKFVNSDCPPIHTIVNGQIVSSHVDANCLSRENLLGMILGLYIFNLIYFKD